MKGKSNIISQKVLLNALKQLDSPVSEPTLWRWIKAGVFLNPSQEKKKKGKENFFDATEPVKPVDLIMWGMFLSQATGYVSLEQLRGLLNYNYETIKNKPSDDELKIKTENALLSLKERAGTIDKETVELHNSMVIILLAMFNGLLGSSKKGAERRATLRENKKYLTDVLVNAKDTVEAAEKYLKLLCAYEKVVAKFESTKFDFEGNILEKNNLKK